MYQCHRCRRTGGEQDDRDQNHSHPSNVRLARTLIRQILPLVPLLFQSLEEPQIRKLNHDPADESRDSSNVHQPPKDKRRVVVHIHVRQRDQQACCADGVVRDAEAVASLEELRRMSVAAQAIERA